MDNDDRDRQIAKQEKRLIVLCATIAAIMLLAWLRRF